MKMAAYMRKCYERTCSFNVSLQIILMNRRILPSNVCSQTPNVIKVHHVHTRSVATNTGFSKNNAVKLTVCKRTICHGSAICSPPNRFRMFSRPQILSRSSSYLKCHPFFWTSTYRISLLQGTKLDVACNPWQNSRQFCSVSRTCWNCQTNLANNGTGSENVVFFCHGCKMIQPVHPESNYFQIMQW